MLKPIIFLFLISLSFSCRPLDDHSSLSSAHDHEIDHLTHHNLLMKEIYPNTKKITAKGRKGVKMWHDASTWKGGSIPESGTIVVIPEKVSVTINQDILESFAAIEVYGSLTIENNSQPVNLKVETIFIGANAKFRIGSRNNPIKSSNSVTVTFTYIDQKKGSKDKLVQKRGLLSMSPIEIYGESKTEYILTLNNQKKDDTSINISGIATDNWNIGDELLLPSTGFVKHHPLENEVVEVKRISKNNITLKNPIEYNHEMNRNKVVANLTRSVVFKSEKSDPIEHRAHIMLMNCGDSVIEYARFEDLGRSNKRLIATDTLEQGGPNPRGRYPVHFHKCGFDKVAKFKGNVVKGSPGWALVNHSSNVEMDNNIVFEFDGVGFATEAGNELGKMEGNLAVGGNGLETRRYPYRVMFISKNVDQKFKDRLKVGDLGIDGEGFWLQSPLVRVKDNIAAGNHGAGFMFYGIGVSRHPDIGGLVGIDKELLEKRFKKTVSDKITRKWTNDKYSTPHNIVQDVPLIEFKDNTSYANYMGLKVRYLQHDNIAVFGADNANVRQFLEDWNEDDAREYKQSYLDQKITGMNLWHNYIGAHFTYNSKLELADFDILGDPSNENDVGLEQWHQSVNQMTFKNIEITDYKIGAIVKKALKGELKGLTAKNIQYWDAGEKKSDRK